MANGYSWVEAAQRCSLSARVKISFDKHGEPSQAQWILPQDMNLVQDWCISNNCGRRMSFDTFQFRNKKEMNFFLLKWS